tara:strand:- start:10 stop:885 length:876 start_codon:yes stop_codon:yes gene_type:complete
MIIFGQSITDSLLLYYPMNNHAQDLSGHHFHGTASGVTPVQDRHGNDSSAYYFDGINDYIDFPLNDTLKPDFPITFAFWAKVNQLGVQENKFFSTDFVQNNYTGVWMAVNYLGELNIHFGGGNGSCDQTNRRGRKTTELYIVPNQWYHFTGIIRSATDMELWIDCSNMSATYQGIGNTNIAYSNNISGTIGRMDINATQQPYYYSGSLDEFMMWNRSLLYTEILQLCDSMPIIIDTTNNNTGTNTSVDELRNDKNLVRIIDILGQETSYRKNTPLFYIYNDGTVEKRIVIE